MNIGRYISGTKRTVRRTIALGAFLTLSSALALAATSDETSGAKTPSGHPSITDNNRITGSTSTDGVGKKSNEASYIRHSGPAKVQRILHSSESGYTRVSVVLDQPIEYSQSRLTNPERIFFDLSNTTVTREMRNKIFKVEDAFLKQIRIAQNRPGVGRVVLDLAGKDDCTVSVLENPFRIVIEIPQAIETKAAEKAPTGEVNNSLAIPAQAQQMISSQTPAAINPTISGNLPEIPVRPTVPLVLPKTSSPTSRGDRTLTRMLGLKISSIVIDPGHGGHDKGTVGPGGLMEKDLVLQMALDLKVLLQRNLGADVILTRDDDTFVSLEERSRIANESQADLFISLHANYSSSRNVNGVETYILDFARTEEEREVAARENATTAHTITDLQNLVRKITQADKLVESRELASLVQNYLSGGSRRLFPSTRDRGVKSAPFVVLIGTKMPSILVEVAFLSNPGVEKALRNEGNRRSLAEALFQGIEGYMKTLGTEVAQAQSSHNK